MITAPKWESFFAFVSTQVADGKWTAAPATGIFMTARQFIRRLAELGVISLPGNISSRRFRFGNGATSVETMTDDEFTLLLGVATERTKLHLRSCSIAGCTKTTLPNSPFRKRIGRSEQ